MEKTNLIDIFKQVKPGTKFKSMIHGVVTFTKIDALSDRYPLVFWSEDVSSEFRLSDTGRIIHDTGECIIQPENGESWHDYQMRLVLTDLKDGDFIVADIGRYDEEAYKRWISIYDAQNSSFGGSLFTYCDFDVTKTKLGIDELLEISCIGDEFMTEQGRLTTLQRVTNLRKATDEECRMLRKAISYFGYKWNDDKLRLEEADETEQLNEYCRTNQEDEYGFKTFDKVLVRNALTNEWEPRLFGRYIDTQFETIYKTIDGLVWNYCIPYNENTKPLAYTTFQSIV